jgi:hypothetical protein
MATVTPAAVYAISGAVNNGSTNTTSFNTTPTYSGTFIPTVWSSKLNIKFYAASTFADVSNTNWEGDIKSQGDKVIINNIPDISIRAYVIGTPLTYDVPVPNTIELQIDQGYYFGVNVNDVLEYQAQPNLMDMFTSDAANQIKIQVDRECLLAVVTGCAAANVGATAGALSASYNLGTDAAPVALTASNVLAQITAMASVLDEQNVPESDRFLIMTPFERQVLMNSNLAQAQFMGDSTSILRNGRIGRIDRFDVYVSNLTPRAAAGQDYSGNAVGGALKRHAVYAGHKSAWTFASQINKTEALPNPTDFGQLVRGLVIYGRKVVKPTGVALMQVAG